MNAFFMPDGDGGAKPTDEAEQMYSQVRVATEAASYWPGTFTDRRVESLVSVHNGTTYDQRVGELTSDRLLVLAIFESIDERGRSRYVVQSVTQTVHVVAENVRSVTYFAGAAPIV